MIRLGPHISSIAMHITMFLSFSEPNTSTKWTRSENMRMLVPTSRGWEQWNSGPENLRPMVSTDILKISREMILDTGC